ncbi:hypothetical protein ES703_44418 [subsurface metagenome]
MSLALRHLEAVRYPPELLPSAEYVSPAAEKTAEILNLTRLPPGILVRLKDVGAERSNNAELRFKADNESFEVPAAAIPDLTEPTQYDLLASKSARLSVYAIADLSNYKVWHGLLVWQQTIADKLALEIPLTNEERAINEKLGVWKTVKRGTLPINWDRIKLYEHFPIYRETRSIRKTLPTTGLSLDTIKPRKPGDQFVVLEKVSCDGVGLTAADNVRLTLCRDDHGSAATPLITLNALSMKLDFDLPMFIPAVREINLRLECDQEQANYRCRWTFSIMHLTNILKVRWGLLSKEEMPELWEKCKAGVV